MIQVRGTGTIDLGRLALEHGQGRRLDLELSPDPVTMGEESYRPEHSPVEGRLDLSRTSRGWALRLQFEAKFEGACVRCLEPAAVDLAIDAREIDEAEAIDEELRSPYVDGLEVDVAHWADDAVALAMPPQPLCRPDCAGLCPVCGVSLNDADPADHEHGQSRDPRWAKLDELKLD